MSYDKTGFPHWALKELRAAGYAPQCVMDPYIPVWWDWYRACGSWYESKDRPDGRTVSMHPARKLCDEFEWLMLDGDIAVSCADSDDANSWLGSGSGGAADRLMGSLQGFVSRYMALGTGALAVELRGVSEGRSEAAEARVRAYDADELCPLVATSDECTACAFARDTVVGGRLYSQLQVHEPVDGQYRIRTWMYERIGERRVRRAVEGVAGEVWTGSPVPTFRLATPAVSNELEPGTPMGVSVFAGCVDQLKDVDAKYDDWHWTPRLCRPRVVVDERGLVRNPKTGEVQYGDTVDACLYSAVGGYGESGLPVTVVNPDARVDQLKEALSTALGALGDKVGFGPGYFRFDSGEAVGAYKTATEVASGNQRLMRVVQRHEAVLGAAVSGVLEAAWCCERGLREGRPLAPDEVPHVAVAWDDSVMEDDAAKRAAMKDDIARGLCPAWLYPATYYGMTEAEARAFTGSLEPPEDEPVL